MNRKLAFSVLIIIGMSLLLYMMNETYYMIQEKTKELNNFKYWNEYTSVFIWSGN